VLAFADLLGKGASADLDAIARSHGLEVRGDPPFTETKKQSPNTGPRANNTLHK